MRIYGTNVNVTRLMTYIKFEGLEIEDGCQPAALELYSSLRIRGACRVNYN
jgi:hypothetical protein